MKGNPFIKQRVMAVSIGLLILLVGFISLNTLPMDQYPDIAPPTVVVSASYDGADAKTAIKSVIQPLEEAINGVEDMYYMKSTATSTGNISILVFFKPGTNPDMAAVNVQNRVSMAQPLLPQEVLQFGVSVAKQQNNILQVFQLESPDGSYDPEFIANYLDIAVKPRLTRVTGVGKVESLGNTFALRIWMKPDVMAAYKLMPEDLFAAVGTQSLVAPVGSLGKMSENTYEYKLEYSGRLRTVEEFRSIVLRSEGGKILRLGDVADIELGARDYTFTSKGAEGPAVITIVYQAPGANAKAVNAEINEVLREAEQIAPAGLKFSTLLCSDDFLDAAMHNVVETLILAILLVILVVFFFLQDFKATLIPSISIIVSLMGTFAIVKLAGFSLNLLTLFALVLAIGTVVDDAIVVTEAVMTKLQLGEKNVVRATTSALSEVTMAAISTTLVFMAVFIPVMFSPGTSGAFFKQFGITLASSVGLSTVSALILCPALCVMLLRPKGEKMQKQKKSFLDYTRKAYEVSYDAVSRKYFSSVKKFMSAPAWSWILLVIAAGGMIYLMKVMPSGLVPNEDQGVFMVEVRTAPGSTLNETNQIMDKVEAKIRAIPEMETYGRVSGYGLISSAGSCYGTFFVRLKNWEERSGIDHYIDLVATRFYMDCEDIKEAQVIPFTLPQVPGFGTSSQIELMIEDKTDGDMTAFNNKVTMFLSKLQERPEVGSAESTYSESFPKYDVSVDAVQCTRAGISVQQVLSTLGNYCGQAFVGNYNQFGKVYRILSNALPGYRLDPESLGSIFIRVADGRMAPITQFVTLTPSVGSSTENRFNMYQSIATYVTPASGYSEGQAHQAIREVFEENMNLSDYTYEYGGMSRELEENMGSNTTVILYAIAVFLIYLILASLYNSWFIPFAVLLSIPFGLMGSFLFSFLCFKLGLPGMDNNIYLQTGVVMLIGLLAKTAILITEFAVDKRKQGMPIFESAYEACKDRFRPILMTVLTMIIGMIPLIVAGGAGANGNRSLAIGVTGGSFVGTIALLFVVPVFYLIFQKLHEKFQGPMVKNEED